MGFHIAEGSAVFGSGVVTALLEQNDAQHNRSGVKAFANWLTAAELVGGGYFSGIKRASNHTAAEVADGALSAREFYTGYRLTKAVRHASARVNHQVATRRATAALNPGATEAAYVTPAMPLTVQSINPTLGG